MPNLIRLQKHTTGITSRTWELLPGPGKLGYRASLLCNKTEADRNKALEGPGKSVYFS